MWSNSLFWVDNICSTGTYRVTYGTPPMGHNVQYRCACIGPRPTVCRWTVDQIRHDNKPPRKRGFQDWPPPPLTMSGCWSSLYCDCFVVGYVSSNEWPTGLLSLNIHINNIVHQNIYVVYFFTHGFTSYWATYVAKVRNISVCVYVCTRALRPNVLQGLRYMKVVGEFQWRIAFGWRL